MSNQRLALTILALLCLIECGHATAQQESAAAVVPAGSATYRLVLRVAEAPVAEDFIEAKVSTAAVTATLILPNGQKVTAENAESEGFSWAQGFDGPAPLGSEDYGQYVNVTFRKPAPAGRYTFEYAFQQLHEPARVQAHFTSRMAEYLRLLHSTPGAQIAKAVPFSPSATVTIDLPKEEEEVMFDVVVPDANTDVVLLLPDGRKLRRADAREPEVHWTIEANPDESWLAGFDLAIPVEGVHQVIGFKRAAKGRYEIHASPKTPTKGQLRVAVIPLKESGEAFAAKFRAMELETGEISSSGGIHIRPRHLPFECFVGDKLDINFELVGDVGPEPPKFEVREERRAWLRDTDAGVQLAPPDPAEVVPVQLTQVGRQTYSGMVVPAKPGWVRISVRATGKTASGQPFLTETLLTNSDMIVRPIAARFVGVTAKAVAPEGSSKFDHLEVTATLDVLIPGDYLMLFGVQDAAGTRLSTGGRSGYVSLQAGRQQLRASVPSNEIWRQLRDGPLDISGVAINRTQKATLSWISVPTGNATVRTEAYRHDQWDPGQVYGEDHVTVHGIAPTAAGRFQFAEVEWEVTTPGLYCSWNGIMRGVFKPPYSTANAQPEMSVWGEAKLPPGKSKVSFIYDGATINRFGKQDWTLGAVLNCGDTANSIARNPPFRWFLTPQQKIDLNPGDYEPAHGSFSVQPAPIALRLSPGGSRTSQVWVKDKSDVQFSVTDVPKGMEANLTGPYESQGYISGSLRITALRDAVPGRYFFTVAGRSGREVETTTVILDVTPQ